MPLDALLCFNVPDAVASVWAVLQLQSHLIFYILYSFHPSTPVIPRALTPWHFTLSSVPKLLNL